jgi:hypothetical protein
MSRLVRYIVHQRVPGESRHVGLFTAAYHLRDGGDLPRHDLDRLNELLAWFRAELPVPPGDEIPDGAIFWYRDAGPFGRKMWELAHLLGEYGFNAELVTERYVGRVVYQDVHQVAALPPSRWHR